MYEKLRKGKSGGLSEKQYEALLVDVRLFLPSRALSMLDNPCWMQFDQKAMDHYESDSDDVDESLTVPKPVEDDEVSNRLALQTLNIAH